MIIIIIILLLLLLVQRQTNKATIPIACNNISVQCIKGGGK